MFGPVRAVLVDDTPGHLFNISTGFSAAGIPCTPYWYDREELIPSNKLKPPPPQGGHQYLRVIFSDLNLEETTSGNLAEAITPAINVIEQLVSKNCGPYAVVFWTRMTFDIADIKQELMDRLEAIDIVPPIAVDEIDKDKFLAVPSEEQSGEEVLNELYRETHNKVDSLRDEVIKVLSKYSLLQMLSNWESRAIHAAGRSTNSLFATAKLQGNNHTDLPAAMTKISALIAKETAGPASATEDPARAYDAAMQDMLVDSFSDSVNEEGYRDIVSKVLKDTIRQKIEISNKEVVHANLNAMFHLDFNVAGASASDRGVVIELGEGKKNGIELDADSFCCWQDYFWEPMKSRVDVDFPVFSKAIESKITQEVRKLENGLVPVIKEAITGLRQQRNRVLKENHSNLKDSRKEFTESLRWLLFEAGADCDHAQSKPRSLRYLVGVEVPAKYMSDYVFGGTQQKLRNEALRKLGPYCIDGELVYLLVSLKRYVAWQPPLSPLKIQVEFRFRKALVDYLLNNYASWSTRPGIIDFH